MGKELFYYIGRAVCHQLPSRSFWLDGMTLPLCARCTGMYAAMLLSVLWLYAAKRQHGNQPFPLFAAVLASLFFLPIALDGVTSYLHLRETNNTIRFVTGVLFAVMIPAFYILISNFRPEIQNNKPIIKKTSEIWIVIGRALLLFPWIQFGGAISWFLLSGFLCAAVFLPFYGVTRMILRLLRKPKQERLCTVLSFCIATVILIVFSSANQTLAQYMQNK